MATMDVGVRELKDRLSEILDKAASGEIVRVTDRGVPKALIVPQTPAPTAPLDGDHLRRSRELMAQYSRLQTPDDTTPRPAATLAA